MSGHSKWASIKRKKGANDQARGRLFSRYAREIIVAARDGGGNPELNPRLRLIIQKAKKDGMPGDTIDRAVKKGSGELGGEQLVEQVYEGYGPYGVAFMIDTLTDNKNRTVGEIRSVFNKLGGSLGETNCVAYQFETKGTVTIDRGAAEEDDVLMVALEAGAEDMTSDDEGFVITCPVEQLGALVDALTAAGMAPAGYETNRIAQQTVPLDEHQARRILKMVDALDSIEDVQQVHANFDIDESVLEAVGAEA